MRLNSLYDMCEPKEVLDQLAVGIQYRVTCLFTVDELNSLYDMRELIENSGCETIIQLTSHISYFSFFFHVL
jgi:hypothetical protein